MVFKLLACDVLTREVAHCMARCPHTVYPVFTAKGEHNIPGRLRALVQSQIDAAPVEHVAYDAILLAYGLCGNAISGLISRDVPLVVPRAHDCTTLFLGSKEAFHTYFGDNPSQAWSSVGYAERNGDMTSDGVTRDYLGIGQSYDSLVAQYGEENAAYLWESMRPKNSSSQLYFIDVPETRQERLVERIRETAAREHKGLEFVPGSIRLIEALLSGEWSPDDFLTVPPGHRIEAVYDYDRIIEAVPVNAIERDTV